MASSLHFCFGPAEDAVDLVLKHHYSNRWPGTVQAVGVLREDGGLFGDMGPIIAACTFSSPPTRWSEPVWELTRLVRRPDTKPPLTSLIAQTCKMLRRKGCIDLVVSFADWTERHHGGVYQAASWNYHGMREPAMDGLIIEGNFMPGRSCNGKYGTRSATRLAEQLPGRTIEAHFDDGKHLYWRALNANGKKKAERLGLQMLPYPKPETAGV